MRRSKPKDGAPRWSEDFISGALTFYKYFFCSKIKDVGNEEVVGIVGIKNKQFPQIEAI